MTRHRRAVAGSAASPGLTLVEMLVVLVLASLLGTLIVQGTGFFLARYDAVDRTRRESSLATLREHWFASTVAAMVPSRLPARRFTGDNAAFEGVSLQPLSSIGGRPVRIRWSIDATRVLYTEPGLRPWTVLSLDEGGTPKFQYADSAGHWRERWAGEDDLGHIPRLVRLLSSDGRVLWLAHFDLYPQPVPNYREEF